MSRRSRTNASAVEQGLNTQEFLPSGLPNPHFWEEPGMPTAGDDDASPEEEARRSDPRVVHPAYFLAVWALLLHTAFNATLLDYDVYSEHTLYGGVFHAVSSASLWLTRRFMMYSRVRDLVPAGLCAVAHAVAYALLPGDLPMTAGRASALCPVLLVAVLAAKYRPAGPAGGGAGGKRA